MRKTLQKISFSSLILSISFLLSLFCLPVYAENDRESCYRSAKELLFSRQFEEAIGLFDSLDNYADSRSLSEYARFYLDTEPEFGDAFLSDNYIRKTYEAGKLYSLSNYGKYRNCSIYKGDIYVPDSINADTSFVQYFCGGGEGEDYLWYRGMYDYFETYSPNAIIVFTNESGTLRIPQRLSFQWDILRQVAYECGTIVHDLSSVGSSNGAYTAMQLAYHFYVNYGLKINRVLTLDTGVYWNLDCYSLTQEQCNAVAEAGTEFYLFEEPAFIYDLQKAPIRYILQSGIPTTALICKHDNHDTISRNAYAYGLFDFCAGEEIDLPSWEYFSVTLYDGISQLGDIFWEDEP